MSIVFYISGHGFGHASRDIEVLNALLDRRPDVPVVVRTPAERWLFDLTLRHPVVFERADTDTGIVQIDSLRLDATESIRRAAAFHADLERRAAAEARRLAEARARLVVADIPPLAFRAAARAGIPSIALGNFTWDWIYDGYPETRTEAPDLPRTLAEAYATAALALRLPMHGGFSSVASIRDIAFVARHSHRDRADVLATLGLPADRHLVLLSFGGHGLRGLDLDRIDTRGDYLLLTTGAVLRDETATGTRPGTGPLVRDGDLAYVNERGLYDVGLRYEDLVAACDVVVTKPGYGIIAECLANGTAMLYTSRGHFVEYDVLVRHLPRVVRSRFISQDDLYAGIWRTHLDALLAQPPPPERPATNGADVAADLILDMFERL